MQLIAIKKVAHLIIRTGGPTLANIEHLSHGLAMNGTCLTNEQRNKPNAFLQFVKDNCEETADPTLQKGIYADGMPKPCFFFMVRGFFS